MFKTQRTIYCSQMGEGSVIRNSSLVDLLQDTSFLHLDTHPVLSPYFKENNCNMFLISRQVDIIRRPAFNETVSLTTGAYELNRMYGFRNTMIYDQSGEAIVKCVAGGAFMDLSTQRPMRIPKEILEQVETFPKAEMEYLPRKIALPDRDPDEVNSALVRRADIDLNGHVNNARYFDLTDEFTRDPLSARRLRIEYLLPLKYGDEVQARVWNCEDSTFVELASPQGKSYCIVEYCY